jgi:hypothetical protein
VDNLQNYETQLPPRQNLRITEESIDIYDFCVLKNTVITSLNLITLAQEIEVVGFIGWYGFWDTNLDIDCIFFHLCPSPQNMFPLVLIVSLIKTKFKQHLVKKLHI